MRWITDQEEFKQILRDAITCVYTDSGRNETNLQRLQFDDGFFGSKDWSFLLKTMMEWSGLEKIYFTVLDPDPDYYFQHRYGVYPCFELEKDDFPENFTEALNKPYGNQQSERLIVVRMEFTVTSPDMPWFIHALQSNGSNGGHLWVPEGWPQRIFEFNRNFVEASD